MAEPKKTEGGTTPLMKQYGDIKSKYPDAIVLFRMGDFYETFGSDAVKTAAILGITLTKRGNGSASEIELAGFPHHALDNYLPKLVRAGERVAICDQLEDPKTAKGLVKRGITELVTPGVVLSDNILNTKDNTFLAAVYFGAKATGVALVDISTGEFLVGEGTDDFVDKVLAGFAPKEVLYQRGERVRFESVFGAGRYTYKLDEWVFGLDTCREKLIRQLGVKNLKGFGIERLASGISAAGAVLHYLEFTEHNALGHITGISRIDQDKYVWVDRFTIRNLELFASNSAEQGGRDGSLLGALDETLTPMGGRLIKQWIAFPIKDIDRLSDRHDVVEALVGEPVLGDELGEVIGRVGDLERMAARIASGRILPREVVQLKASLEAIGRIRELVAGGSAGKDANPVLEAATSALDGCEDVVERIGAEVYPDPASNQIQKGGVVASGVDIELDDLRRIVTHGREVLAEMTQREIAATGISSLKIVHNNVFGYGFEVRDTHKDKVPAEWIRKQTLKGAERYVTAELKEYEEKIVTAQSRMIDIEVRIWNELVAWLGLKIPELQRNAATVARLDVLMSFARTARARNYTRPVLDDSHTLDIKDGRHPVIERLLGVGEEYVPNDVFLDNDSQQIMMITGPNMSGKSALLRQTALIVLMAQTGSFVPASRARIGLVDRIFTRVGASDNISGGESTFMVEMNESAQILSNISSRSLVLLDEIGRGTSTYDGIAIAWAMVEYLHNHPRARAKTLFATHYHELNEMAEQLPRVRNFHVAVKEISGISPSSRVSPKLVGTPQGGNGGAEATSLGSSTGSVIFLRKLVPGGTDRSFGIHVARIAGMPRPVVDRAEKILAGYSKGGTGKMTSDSGIQLSIFQLDDPVLVQIRDQIAGLDIDSLTPIEALNKLNEIKKITGL